MAAPVSLQTSDGRFGYEAAGDPEQTPLVFLHGIGGAARAWRGQLEVFGDRYRALAWDMPGYGGSTPLAAVRAAFHRRQCSLNGVNHTYEIDIEHSLEQRGV